MFTLFFINLILIIEIIIADDTTIATVGSGGNIYLILKINILILKISNKRLLSVPKIFPKIQISNALQVY